MDNEPQYSTIAGHYMKKAFLPDIDKLVEEARDLLKDVEYDTMVGTGLSGALAVPILARAFGKYWAIVRKPGDSSHSSDTVEGQIGRKWIFVDDLVDSGRTRERVRKVISGLSIYNYENHQDDHIETEYVGTYQYQREMYY